MRCSPGQPGAVLAMREATIKAARPAAETMVRLHVRATKLIVADPARAADDTLKVIGAGLITKETLIRAFKSAAMHPIANPHEVEASTERLGAYQVKLGTLARPVPIAELFGHVDLRRAARRSAMRSRFLLSIAGLVLFLGAWEAGGPVGVAAADAGAGAVGGAAGFRERIAQRVLDQLRAGEP